GRYGARAPTGPQSRPNSAPSNNHCASLGTAAGNLPTQKASKPRIRLSERRQNARECALLPCQQELVAERITELGISPWESSGRPPKWAPKTPRTAPVRRRHAPPRFRHMAASAGDHGVTRGFHLG